MLTPIKYCRKNKIIFRYLNKLKLGQSLDCHFIISFQQETIRNVKLVILTSVYLKRRIIQVEFIWLKIEIEKKIGGKLK